MRYFIDAIRRGGWGRRAGAALLGALAASGCGGPDPAAGLSAGSPEERRQAAEQLGREAGATGDPRVVGALARSLIGDEDTLVRAAAARSLGEVARRRPGADAEARPALSRALEDPEAEVRHEASVALARLGADPEAIYLPLMAALRSPNHVVRDDSDAALSALPVSSLAHLEALLRGLDDGEPVVRRASRMALLQAELALDPADAAGSLAGTMVPTAEAGRRALLATVLGRLPADTTPARDQLVAALGDPEAGVRAASATALRPFAADNPIAADALRAATIEDEDRDVRVAAAAALADPSRPRDEARRALLDAIDDEGPASGLAVALDTDATGSVRRLIEALGSDDPAVRAPAARGLGLIAPGADEDGDAIAALVGALEDPEAEVRVAAADALSRFGPRAREASSALEALAVGDDRRAAAHAAAALYVVAPPPSR